MRVKKTAEEVQGWKQLGHKEKRMMRVKKTAEEVQEQIKNAIPDDGFIDLPIGRCLPATSAKPELPEQANGGFAKALVRKVKVKKWFYF